MKTLSRKGSVKSGSKTIGSRLRGAAFAAILPLAAIGCEPTNANSECLPTDDPCNGYNSTTIRIDEGEFDESRPVAGVTELREADGFISEPLRHAVRATHELSTLGLPRFGIMVTQLDDSCFYDPETGLTGSGFARSPFHPCDYSEIFGFYVHEDALTLDDFDLISHEIGHLQQYFGEVWPEVNTSEQHLMLSYIYSGSREDSLRWAAQYTNTMAGLDSLRKALMHIYFEDYRVDDDIATSIREHPQGVYAGADIYILERLRAYQGDYGALLDEMEVIGNEDLPSVVFGSIDRFVERYSGSDMDTSLARVLTELRIVHLRELNRRFGQDAAENFFEAHSHAAIKFLATRHMVMVYGLEGMSCTAAWHFDPRPGRTCRPADGCGTYSATHTYMMSDVPFLCFSADIGEEVSIHGWEVTASGRYYGAGRNGKVSAEGILCNGVLVIDRLTRTPADLED